MLKNNDISIPEASMQIYVRWVFLKENRLN